MYFYKSFIWHDNIILMLVTYASFIVSVLIVYTIYCLCHSPNNCKISHISAFLPYSFLICVLNF